MSKRLSFAIAACLVSISIAQASAALPRSRAVFDAEVDCSAAPPAAYSAAGVTDDGHTVVFEVAFLLDGVKKARARQLVEKVATAYAPLKIELVADSFGKLRLKSPDGSPLGAGDAIDGGAAIEQAKSFLGGERPEGTDAVHVLTDKDLTLANYGSTPAGVAECAGGVQWPDKAFSVSEDPGLDAYSLDAPGVTNVMEAPSETLAHELGHLLGGLHQYNSCAEGVDAADATNGDPSPCTVMSDVVDLASLRFGTLESAVIRGYALTFADA